VVDYTQFRTEVDFEFLVLPHCLDLLSIFKPPGLKHDKALEFFKDFEALQQLILSHTRWLTYTDRSWTAPWAMEQPCSRVKGDYFLWNLRVAVSSNLKFFWADIERVQTFQRIPLLVVGTIISRKWRSRSV
jgi:hypothetical protein